MNTKKKSGLLLTLSLIFMSCVIAITCLSIGKTVYAENELITFEYGASIRIDTKTEDNTTGIRFSCDVDSSIWGNTVGMIIVPQDILDNYDKSGYTDYFTYFEEVYGKTKDQVSVEVDNNYLTQTNGKFYGVINKIINNNFNYDYSAVAYYVDGTTYHYYPCDFSRRIADVANSALLDKADFSTTQQNALSGIIKKAVSIKDGIEQDSITLEMAVGKTVDLGQVILKNYVSANKDTITWQVVSGEGKVKLGFFDNIQALEAGSAVLRGTAYGGTFVVDVNVTIVEPTTAEDVVDYVIDVPSGKDIKILQFSDTQIVDGAQARPNDVANYGHYLTEYIDDWTFKYMRKAFEDAGGADEVDLIVLAGDIVFGQFDDNGTSFLALIEVLESFGVPYAPVYGNHDNETKLGVMWQNEVLKNAEHCIFNQGVTIGNGNYSIGLKQDGKIKRVFYMMDSNLSGTYSGLEAGNHKGDKGFSDDQLDWFTFSVEKLRGTGSTAPLSMVFHIPTVYYAIAGEAYRTSTLDNNNLYLLGGNVESQNGDFGIRNNHGGIDGYGWDVSYNGMNIHQIMKAAGVDAVYCGHIHYNCQSILYDGIRLTYGLKSSRYDQDSDEYIGGTLTVLDAENGEMRQKHLYYDSDFTALMDTLLLEENNGKKLEDGLVILGNSGDIVRDRGNANVAPEEIVPMPDGSIAYKIRNVGIDSGESLFKVKNSLLTDYDSFAFDVYFKDGEITKNLMHSVFSVYIPNGNNGGAAYYVFNESGANDGSGWNWIDYTRDTWTSVNIPLTKDGNFASDVKFLISEGATVYLKNIRLVKKAFTLEHEGETIEQYKDGQVTLTATGTRLTWSSSNDSVATVSDGLVSFVGTGNVTITVTDVDGIQKSVYYNVTVMPTTANYTVKTYIRQLTGLYELDSTVTLEGTPNTTATADTPTKSGYTLNTTKSNISGTIAGDGSLVLNVYYDITGVDFSGFSLSSSENKTNDGGTWTDIGDGALNLTNTTSSVGEPSYLSKTKIDKVENKNYLLVTARYNSASSKTWNLTVFYNTSDMYNSTAAYSDVYVLSGNELVKHSSANIETGCYVVYVIDLTANIIYYGGADKGKNAYECGGSEWYIAFTQERKVDVDVISYAYMTEAQAATYIDGVYQDLVLEGEETTIDKYVGDTYQINVTGTGLTYSSNAPTIASVDASGLVTCHAVGDAVITVTDIMGVSKNLTVNVLQAVTEADYTVNTYIRQVNGVYALDSSVVKQGTPHQTATADTPTKAGYTLNTTKSNITGEIASDGTLVLNVYYDITGVTTKEFSSSDNNLKSGYGSMTDNGDGTFNLIANQYGDMNSAGYIRLDKERNKYLLVTLKYNSYTSVHGMLIMNGAMHLYNQYEWVNAYYKLVSGKFVKIDTINTSDYITYILNITDEIMPENKGGTNFATYNYFGFNPAFYADVDVDLISYCYLTDAQMADYLYKDLTLESENTTVDKLIDDEYQLVVVGEGLTFTSSVPAVATVDAEGWVQCLTAGETVITVTDALGNQKSLTIKVAAAASNASYTVNSYKRLVNGQYVLLSTSQSEGVVGSTVNASTTAPSGYVYNAAKSNASGVVNSEGNLVLNVYYDIDGVDIIDFTADDIVTGSAVSVTANSDGSIHYVSTGTGNTDTSTAGGVKVDKVRGKHLLVTVKVTSDTSSGSAKAMLYNGVIGNGWYATNGGVRLLKIEENSVTESKSNVTGVYLTYVYEIGDSDLPDSYNGNDYSGNDYFVFCPTYGRTVTVDVYSYCYLTDAQMTEYGLN